MRKFTGLLEINYYIVYNFKEYKWITSDNLCEKIEEIYKGVAVKFYRYSIKKDPYFEVSKLIKMADNFESEFKIIKIDKSMSDRIKEERFINIADEYEKYGIGFCCFNNDEIIVVASSNIFYKDGIEVNIRVKEGYRRKGIATAMASKLILECLE